MSEIIEQLGKWLQHVLANNTLYDWLVALALAGGAFLLLMFLRRVVPARMKILAQRTATEWDDAVAEMLTSTRLLALAIVALYLGSLHLELRPGLRSMLTTVVTITLFLQIGLWLNRLLVDWLQRDRAWRRDEDPGNVAVVNALGFVARVALWAVVLLLVLDNIGINVTALVAGLGVGGIAVALAVQNILGDLFASLSIALDKPFAVGDFLIIDDLLGTVENIGLKTTRLRSLSGEQLVFSNTDLLSSRVRNYGRMYERRVVFKLGVTYSTPRDALKRIPEVIREVIEAQEEVRFDRSHFQAYGDFSLDFETVYFVLKADYNYYMDVQQAINLAIHQRFEEMGVDFAFPTQTIHLVSEASPADASADVRDGARKLSAEADAGDASAAA
ncbi:mechanosensitive ion channel family protein [Pseudohalioglobus sediminis]|uniref:Mechanosensitive ion channel family protein n=1 Tax=Pseudohalioglobus sediminis TaxID=2606449 RepID=A0A5B0WS01_9GAMM|nr:mechanosensitive ion channel family protein [Pseudohalioglobus sediminis]KAA1189227.1 mechanosensitive ion channel family protein [Pseudohalioglobus sediminis]